MAPPAAFFVSGPRSGRDVAFAGAASTARTVPASTRAGRLDRRHPQTPCAAPRRIDPPASATPAQSLRTQGKRLCLTRRRRPVAHHNDRTTLLRLTVRVGY
ncbi:hypothetical protein Vau01_095420 [Virgisporangium aurantiacum]|uniref:Uncharacterized protein n=1 Tax=Virgisporangium aurantiacum TaxID=175570 RepID=A0A8J3ZDP6_9ACTN|nr:hypothetical protein Vau01_095420 [Virgisporangium aurantiacum]